MPVMVTGGFRTASRMVEALDAEELDLFGVGRPLIALVAPSKREYGNWEKKARFPEV
jgi:2,4-dienoyl-CoA reductase-like NADH-dependent reductase (Old Yellow Enzyme family)